ncbi:hypothetical protein ABBQ38_004627 [Trebouxia sp. C0009 RCD-2024]
MVCRGTCKLGIWLCRSAEVERKVTDLASPMSCGPWSSVDCGAAALNLQCSVHLGYTCEMTLASYGSCLMSSLLKVLARMQAIQSVKGRGGLTG